MKRPAASRLPSLSRPEHEAIILAVFAGMFAWVMQAALDYYFYAGRTYPEHLLMNVPARELFSRLTIVAAFLLTGFISSRMVRRLEAATRKAQHLDQCVRAVRAVNQAITRESDSRLLCHKSCETLVGRLKYPWVEIRLGDAVMARPERDQTTSDHTPEQQASEVIPIECGEDTLGELHVGLERGRECDSEERELLVEVAEDIGFALRSIRTSEALNHQRDELQTILDSVPAYIAYKDADGRFLRVNRAVANLVGIPVSRWVGKRLSEIVPGATDASQALDDQVMESGEPRRTAIGTLDFGPNKRWVQTDRIPYRDRDGTIAGVISLSVDITDLMETQRALAIKEEELRQSQKMEAIGQLAGGIAHDFNNLLTAIGGFTELALQETSSDEEMTGLLSPIADATHRAACLTNQLLAFGRRQPLSLATHDLSRIVEGMGEILRRLIGEDIELQTELGDQLGKVEVDQSQIEQLVLNLAVNARDAMPEGGTLCIRTRPVKRACSSDDGVGGPDSTRFVCLQVADSGMGMDRETLDRIFEPFFTTKEQGVGTGLGLSVVFGIVKQHGGTIEVRSEPHRGTTFEVYLPVAPAEEEAAHDTGEARGESPQTPLQAGQRILLVEDEETVRDLAVLALRRSGFEVVATASAEEAEEVLARDDSGFQMVFSDIVLPGKSGIELAEEITARDPGARILLASGYPGRTSGTGSTPEVGFPFLGKPYSIRALLDSVRSVLC